MGPGRRLIHCVGLGLLALGCQGPGVIMIAPPAVPTAPEVDRTLRPTEPTPIEPMPATLLSKDPGTAEIARLTADAPDPYLALTEARCRKLASAQSPAGKLLDQENRRPLVVPHRHLHTVQAYSVEHAVRALIAEDARRDDAAQALKRFFDLAEAEAKRELLTKGLQSFDRLRQEAQKLRAAGLPAPSDDELVLRRGQLLLDLEQVEAGIKLLNLDLKARMGLPTDQDQFLWPMGEFAIDPKPIDPAGAVTFALEHRPDLRAHRELTSGMTEDLLPLAREVLGSRTGIRGVTRERLAATRLGAARRNQREQALLESEVQARRDQLAAALQDREAAVAAEVRAAVVSLESAGKRVALVQHRVDHWQGKIESIMDKVGRPAEVLQAELEWYRARGDLITEIMQWHRQRIQLTHAVGRWE